MHCQENENKREKWIKKKERRISNVIGNNYANFIRHTSLAHDQPFGALDQLLISGNTLSLAHSLSEKCSRSETIAYSISNGLSRQWQLYNTAVFGFTREPGLFSWREKWIKKIEIRR